LPFPSFGTPTIINGRREIQVLTCIDASGAEAGTYTGQISLNGPVGFTGATVTTTINAKNEVGFWLGLLFVLVVAGIVLWFLKVDKELKTLPQKLVAIGVSAALAGVAMWSIYDKDPAWGADIVTNLIALAGTGFGAIGIGSLVSPIVKKATP
jgi:hypothetical protein